MTKEKSSEKIFELENKYKYIAQSYFHLVFFSTHQALFIPLVNVSTFLSIWSFLYHLFGCFT